MKLVRSVTWLWGKWWKHENCIKEKKNILQKERKIKNNISSVFEHKLTILCFLKLNCKWIKEKVLIMLPKEVEHIGDGLISAHSDYLKKILVSDAEIEQHYDVEVKPFAR